MQQKREPRIALIGLPGTGKSTLSAGLAKHFDLAEFCMGDILRNPEQYPGVSEIIGNYDVHNGGLLTNSGVCDIIGPLLKNADGWVVDGVPRKVGQLIFMEQDYPPDAYVILECPYTVIWDRITKRSTGSADGGRKDDALPAFLNRLWQFDQHTRPVISALRASPIIKSITITQDETTTMQSVLDTAIAYVDRIRALDV